MSDLENPQIGKTAGEAAVEADPELEELDIETYSGSDRKPAAKHYRFRVDKQHLVTNRAKLTGAEILTLANKLPPTSYLLFQVLKGGQSPKVELDETVDLRAPGVEKFRTLPRDQTEG